MTDHTDWQARAEKAEAEVARLNSVLGRHDRDAGIDAAEARAERAEAALRAMRAIKLIDINHARLIINEVEEDADDHRARLRALTVAACAVHDLSMLTAALASTATEGETP